MSINAPPFSPDIPIAHVDDPRAVAQLLDALQALHGPAYRFSVDTWEGETEFATAAGTVAHRFLIHTHRATVRLRPDETVRGPAPDGPYRSLTGDWAVVTAPHGEALWPGDVLTAAGGEPPVRLSGSGTYFQVTTEATDYEAPRLALLRHLTDHPGGCAAYAGAFRREALPPQRPPANAADARGVNRVNEHTLDMRNDRVPPPSRHHHGPVAVEDGWVNHSETAIVLPRAAYGLPEVNKVDRGKVERGHLVLYPDPQTDPAETVVVPVQPGSIVVTPATPERAVGHCFENVFAMLIAIPGFVSPYHFIKPEETGKTEETGEPGGSA